MSEKILTTEFSEVIDQKYLDYAKDVITDRALPDARDGLKPVQRRILWAMYESGYLPGNLYKKSARIVGDVMGKYHPHGDSSIYGALVKLQQPFVRNIPLIDGHGNFGTIDDAPAAMRYTEARLSNASLFLLQSIKKDTVNFVENYEGSEKEPVVLPAEFPNLLVNGSSGIAVGMASDIPPHNLCETIDAACALVKNPNISIHSLMEHIKGPDFPTGGTMSPDNILSCYETGRGAVAVRSKVLIEDIPGGRQQIVVTELPYQVSKEGFLKKAHAYFSDGESSNAVALRDESSNQVGMRLVVELAKGVDARSIVQTMYEKPDLNLQKSYNFNMVAIIDGRPVLSNLKQLLDTFVAHRKDTLIRKLNHDLAKAEARVHILDGLLLAVVEIEKIVKVIKKSKSPKEAKTNLMKGFPLSELQVQAILDLKLQRLTSLEVASLEKEKKGLLGLISKIKDILSSPEKTNKELIREMQFVKNEIGETKRRTTIQDFDKVKITVSVDKFVLQAVDGVLKKRSAAYRSDHGVVLSTDSSEAIYIITKDGECLKTSASQIPKKIDKEIIAMINESTLTSGQYVIFVSSSGMVKKTLTADLLDIKKDGSVLKMKDGECLVEAFALSEDTDVALFSKEGMCIRFPLSSINPTGRIGIGVKGMSVQPGDAVVLAIPISDASNTVPVLEREVSLCSMRTQNRGGKGVKTKYLKSK